MSSDPKSPDDEPTEPGDDPADEPVEAHGEAGAPGGGKPGQSTSTIEVVHSGGRAHALVRRFRLLCASGPDAGLSCPSMGERLVIGTHDSANLVLHDRTV